MIQSSTNVLKPLQYDLYRQKRSIQTTHSNRQHTANVLTDLPSPPSLSSTTTTRGATTITIDESTILQQYSVALTLSKDDVQI
ncbi:unnamed protein product [Rotaria magnacalcarata]|nr:unnamed protein product [Rotaria magnacalcarata]CAF1412527.1 unnamed protein product [Rotaria magnacalcarata]CAF2060092.1 unnamed protein product [Rotaria magnacalcarata]CAF3921499.1 unnamed protein product [Rotaria magnacalcarata]CAF4041630.1 unnamed protein product [Rotaria magnacalcarata]